MVLGTVLGTDNGDGMECHGEVKSKGLTCHNLSFEINNAFLSRFQKYKICKERVPNDVRLDTVSMRRTIANRAS